MRGKRVLGLIGSICLILVLPLLPFMTACAPEEVTPTPPKEEPTPPAPPPAVPPTPAHEPYEVTLWCFMTGSACYVQGFAIAQTINKYSDWLWVDAMESAGSAKQLKDLADKPELRAKVIHSNVDTTNALARAGLPPFEKPYTEQRVVHVEFIASMVWVTYDDDIKTIDDFKGKKLMCYPVSVTSGIATNCLLKDVWGIWDDVDISYGWSSAIIDRLKDGTIDVGQLSFNGIGDFWIPGPALEQLAVEKPGFHFVDIPVEDVEKMAEISHMPFKPFSCPATLVEGVEQTGDVWGMITTNVYMTDKTMPDDVVYEWLKMIHDHIGEVKDRFPATFLTKDNLGMVPLPEELFHPGALKFYREYGIQIGLK